MRVLITLNENPSYQVLEDRDFFFNNPLDRSPRGNMASIVSYYQEIYYKGTDLKILGDYQEGRFEPENTKYEVAYGKYAE